jgi:WD40 repeat protein
VTTYSIDPRSLEAAAVEQPVSLIPATASLIQFDPSPDDNFVYAVWSDGQGAQHLSVFQTDSSGVPQLPAIQVLDAASLSQFNMHPSGRFAYMLEVTNSNGQYQADIRLFHTQTGEGILKEDPQVQGSYGPASYWPAFLYGFSANGSKLYDTSMTMAGSVYRERPIDLTTGRLGSDTQLLNVSDEEVVAIGKVIVDQYQSDTNVNQSYLDIFPNIPNPPQAVIRCSYVMLSFCATATNVQLDISSNYLFLTDPATQAIHVAAINPSSMKINDTGSSMPMTSQIPGFAFSPDGRIVYALLASDNSVHFYHFDQSSGLLSEAGTPLALEPASGICPAEHQ